MYQENIDKFTGPYLYFHGKGLSLTAHYHNAETDLELKMRWRSSRRGVAHLALIQEAVSTLHRDPGFKWGPELPRVTEYEP